MRWTFRVSNHTINLINSSLVAQHKQSMSVINKSPQLFSPGVENTRPALQRKNKSLKFMINDKNFQLTVTLLSSILKTWSKLKVLSAWPLSSWNKWSCVASWDTSKGAFVDNLRTVSSFVNGRTRTNTFTRFESKHLNKPGKFKQKK